MKKKSMSKEQLLSRQVGKIAGWKIQHGYDDEITHITNAKGELQCMLNIGCSEEEAWDFATSWWCKYATDVNQALTLTVEGFKLELRHSANSPGGVWFAQYYNDDFINAFTGYSEEPAEAICKARLVLAEYFQTVRIAE